MRVKRKIFNQLEAENLSGGRAKTVVLVLVGFVVTLAFTQIYLSGRVAVMGDRIKVLEQRKQSLILESARLQDKINSISTLSYIEKEAREKLGMVSGVEKAWYLSVSETLAAR